MSLFLYFTTTARDAILGHVVFGWGFDSEETFSKSCATPEYCPDIIWTTYLLNFFVLAFDIEQADCGESSRILYSVVRFRFLGADVMLPR